MINDFVNYSGFSLVDSGFSLSFIEPISERCNSFCPTWSNFTRNQYHESRSSADWLTS